MLDKYLNLKDRDLEICAVQFQRIVISILGIEIMVSLKEREC